MKWLCFFLSVLTFNFVASAQEVKTDITVKGDIVNSAGIGIHKSTVRVLGLKDGLIYFYNNLGDKNSFSFKLSTPYPDSIRIIVSHNDFDTKEIIRSTKQDLIHVEVELEKKSTTLQEVEIKAPPIWKRGDTTFYKVEAFKEGDEIKLKDILLKMPDFDEDDRGNIRFKKKVIERITIDGEAIFSDKTKLLVDNFPVHVLETIQAIENQSNQKLLKGLSNENRVFLNLGLDKKIKLKAAFGDGELGLGTSDQYSLASVVFSIYGKLKAGFIGNWNSLGNGIGFGQERELKNAAERLSSPLLMNNHSLSLINNFENRWYINNRQLDNRLQINGDLFKKVKSSTELSFLTDRQSQNAFFNYVLYTENRYEERIDSTSNRYRPSYLGIRQNLTFDLDSTQELKVIANLFVDQSKGSQNAIYRGFNISSPLAKNTENAWWSYSLSANYVKRHSSATASTFDFSLNRQTLNQFGLGKYNDLDQIFNQNLGLNVFSNDISNNVNQMAGTWSFLRKSDKTKRNWNYSLGYLYTHANVQNEVSLGRDEFTSLISNPFGVSMDGSYANLILEAGLSGAIDVLKMPISFSLKSGIANTKMITADASSSFKDLLLKVDLNNRHRINDRLNGSFNLNYDQQPRFMRDGFSSYYATSLVSFSRSINDMHFSKQFGVGYIVSYKFPRSLSDIGLSASYNKNLNNVIRSFDYQYFFMLSQDSLTNLPSAGLNINLNSQIPSLFFNALFNIHATYYSNQSYLLLNQEPVLTQSEYYGLGVSIKKNWNKKYFIRLQGDVDLKRMIPPKGLAMQVNTSLLSYKSTFYQRWVISNRLSWLSNLNYFNYQMASGDRRGIVLLNSEWKYSFKDKPFFISLVADNLLGETFYFNFSNSQNGQVFRSIPLRPRSFYAAVKYNF